MANMDIVHVHYRIKSVREGLSKTQNLIADMSQIIETLHEENAALQKRLDAAVGLIDRLENGITVISGATEYIKPGTGVCHTTGIMLQAIENWRGESVRIKASVNDEAGYYEAVNPLKTAKVLYIDDFFKTQQGRDVTAGDVNLAFEIINYHYNDPKLITIISSERTLDDVLDIDQATGSRIYQRCGDYRITITNGKDKNYRLREDRP